MWQQIRKRNGGPICQCYLLPLSCLFKWQLFDKQMIAPVFQRNHAAIRRVAKDFQHFTGEDPIVPCKTPARGLTIIPAIKWEQTSNAQRSMSNSAINCKAGGWRGDPADPLHAQKRNVLCASVVQRRRAEQTFKASGWRKS